MTGSMVFLMSHIAGECISKLLGVHCLTLDGCVMVLRASMLTWRGRAKYVATRHHAYLLDEFGWGVLPGTRLGADHVG
jgi:hypothetical protein